ncbi:Ig-like domain repeat protein [Methanobrevibacter sp.]|uniref:Ig-like domain repeat protein n=1 Tax=Methanobrevibacter sp. TaxID=66852 RepID=UPI00388F358D
MKRKFLILFCLVVFIVSVAGVSAAEDVNQTIEDNGLSVSQDDEIIADFEPLQEKINKAQPGSTINLDTNYVAYYDSPIIIEKAITINGNNHIIDGNEKSRLFMVKSDNVVLNNINFINGYVSRNNGGAAIYSEGNLILNNCNFENNFAEERWDGGDGGAIYTNGTLSVNGCIFRNNIAEVSGGAIYSRNALTITDSIFCDNVASDMAGGAISVSCDGCSNSIDNSTFENNIARRGGAISTGNSIVISNSRFINNTATGNQYSNDGGGAIYLNSYSVEYFTSNNNAFVNNNGGAIYSENYELSIIKSLINSSNICHKGDGHIHFDNNIFINIYLDAAYIGDSLATVYNCNFVNSNLEFNSATINSSFFENSYMDAVNNLKISNCEFIGNIDRPFIRFGYYVVTNPSISLNNNKMSGTFDYDIDVNEYNCFESPMFVSFYNRSIESSGNINDICKIFDSDNNTICINNGFDASIKNVYYPPFENSISIKWDDKNKYYVAIPKGYYSEYTLDKGLYEIYSENSYLRNKQTGFIRVGSFDDSLNKLIYEAKSGDTINLNKDYTCSIPVYIDKPLTINGNGHIINGNNNRIFFIKSSGVEINDIIFINGYTNLDENEVYSGGAIYSKGHNVLIKNSVFKNNKGYFAGAVDLEGRNNHVKNCTFIDNSVIIKPGEKITISHYESGHEVEIVYTYQNSSGAIVWVGDNGILENCEFINNNGYYSDVYWIGKNGKIINSTIKLEVPDVTKNYGGPENLEITLTESDSPIANAKVNININGGDYTRTTDSNGKASLPINLNADTYIATVSYQDISTKAIVTVNKLASKTSLAYTKNAYNSVTLTASVNPSSVSGKVTFNVNGKDYAATVSDAKATYTLNNLAVGSYSAVAKYKGDVNHKESSSNSVRFTVEDVKVDVIAPDLTKYYKGPERFVVTVKEDNVPVVGKDVTINLNGVPYTRTTDSNGAASMAINLDSGIYNVTSEFEGIKVYSTITVKTTIESKDITKIFRNDTQYYATFRDSNGNLLRNTDVNFNINGVFYTRTTNENGVARMNINLLPKQYVLTAMNPVSGESCGNLITVLPNIVENYDLTKYYKNASKFTFRLLDNKGNPVGAGVSASLNINGVFYTRTTDENGYINMNINLNPGTYIATIMYNGLSLANTIKVLPILEAKDVVMKYRDGTKFEAKLLDGQGKPYAEQSVTFNINGVLYNRPTDSSGTAKLNINLMPGEYIITSMYENGAAISNRVTIRS